MTENELNNRPGENHVINTLVAEHTIIQSLLDELEKKAGNLLLKKSFEEAGEELEQIKQVILKIIDAEPHHQREEQVLFTELERLEIVGPPKMMRWEHHQMRQYKHEIKDLAENSCPENFEASKKGLNFAVCQLVNDLREHIFKENNILYPMSLDAINETEKWDEMKTACDKIGYCSFTPKELYEQKQEIG